MKALIKLITGVVAWNCLLHGQTVDWGTLLRASNPELRIRGVKALSVLEPDRAISSLAEMLEDTDAFVRSASRQAILHIGKPAVDLLIFDVTSDNAAGRF